MAQQRNKLLFLLAVLACAWTLVVIVLGAYVRLSHAGLGCPDWPGCYGHMVLPESVQGIDSAKAWKEMTHRYAAGGLGFLILLITMAAFKSYDWTKPSERKQLIIPVLLPILIVFQALLGMWTVTLLLKPLVVTAHLLGGMCTLALLLWLAMSQLQWPIAQYSQLKGLRRLAVFVLMVLVLQIALGGWLSSNYAALACYGFPQCNDQWWPAMDFKDAFIIWRGLGIDYEGGVLDHPARVAIHMAHRLGAVLVSALLLWLCLRVMRRVPELRQMAAMILYLLLVQIGLGIANVMLGLPLPVATAHNANAALMLIAMVFLIHRLYSLDARR
jgi:cytochrome c oxidase assembly protein subunit 15